MATTPFTTGCSSFIKFAKKMLMGVPRKEMMPTGLLSKATEGLIKEFASVDRLTGKTPSYDATPAGSPSMCWKRDAGNIT